MNDLVVLLQERFSELVSWEKLKRKERLMISAFCYSLLISLIALPAKELWQPWASPFVIPAVIFLVLVLSFFLLHPWRSKDSFRAVLLLDKTLRMEERAITAWEILGRREKRAAELLVIKEAEEKLRGVDPRTLFKRQLIWHGISASLIFLLWLLFVWAGDGIHFARNFKASQPDAAAQKLREFSRDLQEKAISHGLTESLEMAQAIEKVAEERLTGKMDEKGLRENLAGMIDALRGREEARAKESNLPLAMATREGLLDLKAELETLRTTFLPDSARRQDKLGPAALEQLGTLPRLKGELGKDLLSSEKLEEKDLYRFLDRLEKGVVTELDHRTLLEIREFLGDLQKGIEGRETETIVGQAEQAEPGRPSQAERAKTKGIFPGDQYGTKGQPAQPLPSFDASAGTHLKGLLGEGKSGSLSFREEARGRKSEISQEEILASYRRQAEEELSSEHIPGGLKETIKKYFLSLGMAGSDGEERR